jgi:hypothetical protein
MNFPLRAAALSSLLIWAAPRAVRAEESVRYKYQDYREAGGRVAVEVHSAAIEKDFGPAMRLKVEGVVDAIAGATPNGQPAPAGSTQVPLSKLTDKRKAWNAAFSRQFERVNLALGVANSRESDYVSDGWSLNTLTDFNQKNTTLLAGVAGTHDDVKVFFQTPRARKRTNDVIVGVTQLLDRNTSLTANLTWGRQTGYLADPYKLVQKDTEIIPGVFLPLTFPENRPRERDKWIALAALNRAFPAAHGALDASYRATRDTFGLRTHTLDLAWFQHAGSRVIVRPGLRFYQQNAADFYRYRLDGTSIVPTAGAPRPNGPFYSSDWRLSAMRTWNYGLKLIVNATDSLQFDAAFERYEMRGRDGVTPQSAYCRADILTLGAKYSW